MTMAFNEVSLVSSCQTKKIVKNGIFSVRNSLMPKKSDPILK